MMVCPNCGNNLEDNAKFCVKCGISLENAIFQEETQTIPDTTTNNIVPTISNNNKKYKILSAVFAVGFVFMLILYIQKGTEYESLKTEMESLYDDYESLYNDYDKINDENDSLRGNKGISSWFDEFFE